ncbi:MAG: hypothetical protein A2X64_01330 [Ignavibacteria bacterium GWF2_33_9]|nr:MAG: hypothetical protein A2X64_01330 [Ignavibacteria bacterium GWF2_33_9]
MKKILYIWKSPYPWDVRVEKFCKSLTEAKYQVHILARWGNEVHDSEVIDNVHIHRVGYLKHSIRSYPLPFNPTWNKAIKKAIEEIIPDLIIVREIMLAETAGKLAHEFKIPIILDMAENYPAAMRAWKKYNKNFISRFLVHKLRLPDKVEAKVVPLMDGIITVCNEQKRRLNRVYKYDLDKIEIVHNTPLKRNFPQKINKEFGSIYTIGHHGYHTSEKSIKNFVTAFAENFKNHENFRLEIAGDGDEIPELMKIAKDCDNVIFHGNFQPQNLVSIISNFDIGILPYQVNDFNNYTIHNKIFDYFALGIPVIVSKAVPLKRIVKETHTGFVVDCDDSDAIVNFINSIPNKNWPACSKNARDAFMKQYRWRYDSIKLIDFCKSYLSE